MQINCWLSAKLCGGTIGHNVVGFMVGTQQRTLLLALPRKNSKLNGRSASCGELNNKSCTNFTALTMIVHCDELWCHVYDQAAYDFWQVYTIVLCYTGLWYTLKQKSQWLSHLRLSWEISQSISMSTRKLRGAAQDISRIAISRSILNPYCKSEINMDAFVNHTIWCKWAQLAHFHHSMVHCFELHLTLVTVYCILLPTSVWWLTALRMS